MTDYIDRIRAEEKRIGQLEPARRPNGYPEQNDGHAILDPEGEDGLAVTASR